jgi:DNA-binding MarR family transcriptional regulator
LERTQPVTQNELARFAHVDPMMTSQVLRVLEDKGLLRRERHPSDARAKALVATPEGVAAANRANGAVEAADVTFFAPLTNEERAFFSQIFTRLSNHTPLTEPET